jgi:hypothetical protein
VSPVPNRAQTRRLREVYRSAGWPCQDSLELELLAAGWLQRVPDASGRERLRLSDAGIQAAVHGLHSNRARRSAHEALVQRTALHLSEAGRITYTGLSLRAGLAPAAGAQFVDEPQPSLPGVPERAAPHPRRSWALCEPDVFSLRPSTQAKGLEVAIHEVKVSRADLLTELRRPSKSLAYAALSGQTWFVLAEGIAEVDEIPPDYGVWIAHDSHFSLGRPAPQRAFEPDLALWLALARATPAWPRADEGPRQAGLGAEPWTDARP